MREVFAAFLKLGLTSFGGPVAHLGYFHDEFVVRRKWLASRTYADLVALCQFLPGPSSSQVGIAIGLSRAGFGGALAAWAAFSLPSAIVLVLFAQGLDKFHHLFGAGGLHGLKIAAAAVVAVAILTMARALPPDRIRGAVVVIATLITMALPGGWAQVGAMIFGAVAGAVLLRKVASPPDAPMVSGVSRRLALMALILFAGLLIGLPVAASATANPVVEIFSIFYRVGSLVFGGGHVVLPLLQSEVVAPGLVDADAFLAGYGAAQAMPGPLFSFAAFLGAVMTSGPSGWSGALVCLVAIYLPSLLLVVGALPFWEGLRHAPGAQAAMGGVNAAVVGLLIAAFVQAIWPAAILSLSDALLMLAAAALLLWRMVPPWLVVLACAIGGSVLAAL